MAAANADAGHAEQQHGADNAAAAAAMVAASSSDAAAPASQTAMHAYLAQIQANLSSHVKWQREQHYDNSLAPDPTVPRITRSPRMGLEQIAQLAAYNHNPAGAAARPRAESAASALSEDSHSARSYSQPQQPQPSVLSASRRHQPYQPNLSAASAAAASTSSSSHHPVPGSAPVSNNIFNPDHPHHPHVKSPPHPSSSYNATMILTANDAHIADLDDHKHDDAAADEDGYNSSSLSSSAGALNTSNFIIDEDDLERSRQDDEDDADAEADQQGRLLQESINASISYEDQSTSDDDDGDEGTSAPASASATAAGSTPFKPSHSVVAAAAAADGESSQATTPLASRAAHAAKLASSNAISTPAQQVYSTRSASPVLPPRDTASAFDSLHIEVPAGRGIGSAGGIGSGLSSHSASAASAMMRGNGGSSSVGIGSGIAAHGSHPALFATPTSSRAGAAITGRDVFLPPQFAAPSPSLQLYGNVSASPSPSTAASSTSHQHQHSRLAGFASPSQFLSPSSLDRRDAEEGVEHTPSTSPLHHHRLNYLPSPSEFALGGGGSPSPSASTPSPAAINSGPTSAPLVASGGFAASASLLATGGPAAAGSRGAPVLARSLSEMNMMRHAAATGSSSSLPPSGLPPAGPAAPRATLTHAASFPNASVTPSASVLSPQSARLQEAYDELAALDPSDPSAQLPQSASQLASADGSVRMVQSPPASSSAVDSSSQDRVLFNAAAPYLPRQRSQDAASRRAARQPPLDALTVDPVSHSAQQGSSPLASPSPTNAIDFRSPLAASSIASPAATASSSYEASEWPADRTSAEPQRRSNPAGSPSSSRNRVPAAPMRGYMSPTAASASPANRGSPSASAAPPRPGRPAYSLTMPAGAGGDRSPPPPRRLASDPAQLLNGVTMTGKERPPLPNRPSPSAGAAASPASAPPAASPSSVLSPSASPSPLSANTAAAPNASPPAPLFTHRIFENFLVLGCSPSPALLEQNIVSWTENPKVLLKFPHTSSVEAADVADFAFPSGVRLSRVDVATSAHSGLHSILYSHRQFVRGSNCHNFVLKTSTNIEKANESEDLFGVCIEAREMAALSTGEGSAAGAVTHDISCPISYCFISRYPFFELHQSVILQILMLLHLKRVKHLAKLNMSPLSPEDAASGGVARLRGKPLGPHQVPACVALLKKYYDTAVPARGVSLKLPPPKHLLAIEFQRPNASPAKEARTLVAHWCCPLAWSYLTPDTLIDLLELALREFKIIVVDANLAMLSAAVMSFQPLLHPLKWAGVFLPILPRKLHEFLEAPVPILVGVDSTPDCLAEQQQEEDMAVWYPSAGKIVLHKSFKRLLPNRALLIAALKPHFTELRRLSPQVAPAKSRSSSSSSSSSAVLPPLSYSASIEEHAHVKIMLHLIETEIVSRIEYVRKTEEDPSSKDKKEEPFTCSFRETQMLSHYLQSHEHDEDDY